MSAEMDSNTRTIYVELLDEGTTVIRPTRGEALARDVYLLLPTPDYDPNDEQWEFPPGSVVRCIREIRDGEEVLVARELALTNPWEKVDGMPMNLPSGPG